MFICDIIENCSMYISLYQFPYKLCRHVNAKIDVPTRSIYRNHDLMRLDKSYEVDRRYLIEMHFYFHFLMTTRFNCLAEWYIDLKFNKRNLVCAKSKTKFYNQIFATNPFDCFCICLKYRMVYRMIGENSSLLLKLIVT